jgi:hypothetical protein
MHYIIPFALGAGVLGVLYALITAGWIMKQAGGTDKMKQISDAVKEGAAAFLAREYRTVADSCNGGGRSCRHYFSHTAAWHVGRNRLSYRHDR